MNNRPARQQAIAKQDEAIQRNVTTIEKSKSTSALAQMASRLNISQTSLQDTLRQTVFAKASDAEFAALIVVANEYRLNPLLKEIYAFPAKGGGIVPIVSIDGWLRIINEHPQFDGIKHEDIYDNDGNFIAVETTIWRKDRNHPIVVMEYLAECKQNTDPWKNMPRRMTRHKSTIQCARYAFGFSGIQDELDAVDGGELTPTQPQQVVPSRADMAGSDDQIETYDPVTGEVVEEVERAADSAAYSSMDGQEVGAEPEINDVLDEIEKCGTVIDVKAVFSRNKENFGGGAYDALVNASNERIETLKGGK